MLLRWKSSGNCIILSAKFTQEYFISYHINLDFAILINTNIFSMNKYHETLITINQSKKAELHI